MTANIFISFASKDVKMAMTLCTALENRGYKCWISARDIQPGENFQIAIVQAIRHAKIMLLVFTQNSNSSEEMTKELALASQQKMIVIPLRVEDVTPSDAFAYEFATRQWIDFFADWEFAIEQLSRRIANALRERSQGLETNDAKDALEEVAAISPVAYTIEPQSEPQKTKAEPEKAEPPKREVSKPVGERGLQPAPRAPPEPPKAAPEPVKEAPAAKAPPEAKPASAKPLEPIHEVRKEALANLKASEAPAARPAPQAPAVGSGGRKVAIAAGIAVVVLVGIALAASTMMRSRHTPEPSQAAAPVTPQPPTVVQVSNPPPPAPTPPAANAAITAAPPASVNTAAVNMPAVNASAPKRKAVRKPKDDIPF
ncbi:MAG TPA: toll/interleukin-1 receptor domain-containing protein [Caulobacteraceae bacterium]|nr:toll/interleukin-1 receptor domain-containing protein [Caulobacteraceae bacterium]